MWTWLQYDALCCVGVGMAGESVTELLRSLTGVNKESAEGTYASWAGLTYDANHEYSLGELVSRKLVANGKSTQVKESLLETIHAGGAIGETVEQTLLKTGLVGWS